MDKKTNPHKSKEYISKVINKYHTKTDMDYNTFYNEINYISPGIHINYYYDECLSLVNDNDQWLDLGCGSAHYIKKAITDKSIRLHGIEIVDKSVKNANENGVICVKGSISEIFPYKDQKFDFVTATDVLEHLHPSHVDFTLKEIHRVLKDNHFALLAPFPKEDATGYIHLTVQPTSWWIKQCEKIGFKFIEETGLCGIIIKKES